jgi:antitoxin component YwqK of YwqJK toxin-antitoxin module
MKLNNNMKIIVSLAVTLSFTMAAFGQTDSTHVHDSLSKGFTNKAEAKNQQVNGLNDGKWVEYYEIKKGVETPVKGLHSADFYRLTVYRGGKPFGKVRTYFKSGELEGENMYVNGRPNGVAKVYYKSGQVAVETPYTDGKINGVRKMYTASGQLMVADTVLNGKEHGIIKLYYAGGNIKTECPFTNDKSNNQEKIRFDSLGIHLFESDADISGMNIVNGQLSGTLKQYYESGVLKSEAPFKQDVMVGKYKEYDENGNEAKQ